jgi:thioredoxin reductase (NADPH)
MALTGDIDNYPGFDEGIDGFTLGMKMQKGAERFGAKTVYAEVNAVDFSDKIKRIETKKQTFFAKTVAISTGADPRTLGIAGEERLIGRGLHYCAHCDGRFYKGKTVAVVGGGNSAVGDALHLSHLAKKVYLIHRKDTLSATRIYHEPLMRADNVEFLPDSAVESLLPGERFGGVVIKGVKDGERRELALDGLFIGIGRAPATELFGELEKDAHGYIVADESTKTSIDGVFAVGDVRTKILRQVVTAVGDGAVAAHFAEEHISLKQM